MSENEISIGPAQILNELMQIPEASLVLSLAIERAKFKALADSLSENGHEVAVEEPDSIGQILGMGE